MSNKPLVLAVLSAMAFLEDAGDNEIDPDSAVKALEHIAYELLQMNETERQEFEQTLEEIAASAENPAYAERVRAVPFMVWGPEDDVVLSNRY